MNLAYTKLLIALLSVFMVSFSIKTLPLWIGYKVPHGWVDTAYHLAVALDVKEGNFDSLIHPWWHLPENIFYLENVSIIDRTRTTFFYPPLLHLLLAFVMLFSHPGVATIATISLLYSLSTVAMFLLCRAYGIGKLAALVSSLLIGTSISLLYSQNFGFWSFTIATIFTLFSNSLFKFYLEKGEKKLIVLSIIFGCLAALTHWVFIVVVLLLALVAYNPAHRKKFIKFYLIFGALSLILVSMFFMLSNASYAVTYFRHFFPENPLFYLFGFIGWILALTKNSRHLLTPLVVVPILLFFTADFRIPFVDMLQFTLPFILAFYIAYLYQFGWKEIKLPLLIFLFLSAGFNLFHLAQIQLSTKPDLTNEQFDGLLQLRKSFEPNATTILAIEERYAPWIVVVAKDSKLISPFNGNVSRKLEGFQIFYIKPANNTFTIV